MPMEQNSRDDFNRAAKAAQKQIGDVEKKIGDAVKAGENLCTVHYNLDARLPPAMRLLSASFEIGDQAPPAAPLVRKIIGAEKIS